MKGIKRIGVLVVLAVVFVMFSQVSLAQLTGDISGKIYRPDYAGYNCAGLKLNTGDYILYNNADYQGSYLYQAVHTGSGYIIEGSSYCYYQQIGSISVVGGENTAVSFALLESEVQDRDGDGYACDVDCNDVNPNINPGAADTPDDNIDSNCDGLDTYTGDKCSINGVVMHKQCNVPVPFTEVDLYTSNCERFTAVSDANGEFSMDGVPCSMGYLVHAVNDCLLATPSGTMPDSGTLDLTVELDYPSLGSCDFDQDGYNDNQECDDCDASINPDAVEVCDNTDNNCDGSIDEGLTQACYTGPAGTEGVGLCTGGTQTCSAGSWGTCDGEIVPTAEECTLGFDEDCDGNVDCDDPDCGGDADCAVEDCTNGIDDDGDGLADGADPDCPCALTNAYWSTDNTTAGSKVTMTVEAAANCEGQEVAFNIFEDDIIVDLDVGEEFVVNPTGTVKDGKAEAAWYAIYTQDGIGGLWDPPEYFFEAELGADPDVSIRSGLMDVWPNQGLIKPVPFLIKPNGGEWYNESANITWNPALDPEDDAVVYTLYYSDDSGATWNLINDNYGYINMIGGKKSFTIDFG